MIAFFSLGQLKFKRGWRFSSTFHQKFPPKISRPPLSSSMNDRENRKHIFVCLIFTTLLFVVESFYLPFKRAETDLLTHLIGWFFTFGSFALVFYFTYSAVSAPYFYRLVYFAIFALAVFTEYGYYSAVEHFSTTEDLENILFGTDLDNKIDAAIIYFNQAALLPVWFF